MNELQQKEEAANRLAAEGKTAEAVRLLYALIISEAEAKSFAKAEALRERLMEIDSLALREIIASAEAIEAAKTKAIDTRHTTIWKRLYEKLSQEEANAFYHSLKEITVEAEYPLIEQGQPNSRLFLINAGELKVVFRKGNDEFLLKQLGQGDIAGQDSFFPITHATSSVIAKSKSHLHFMERSDLIGLSEPQPNLETKLQEFSQPGKINAALRAKGLERRQQSRHNASGSVMIQLLNNAGETIGKSFRGHLEDISSGGLSFMIKSSRKETARLLLGRRGRFGIAVSSDPDQPEMVAEGLVVAVHWYMQNDYAVHVRFDSPLRETEIGKLIPLP